MIYLFLLVKGSSFLLSLLCPNWSFDILLAELTTIQPRRVTGYYTVVAFDFIAVGLSPPFCLAECHSAVVGGREGGHRRVKKALLGGALLWRCEIWEVLATSRFHSPRGQLVTIRDSKTLCPVAHAKPDSSNGITADTRRGVKHTVLWGKWGGFWTVVNWC